MESLEFQILGQVVSAEIDSIPERMRLDEILPVLRVLDDQFLEVAISRDGRPVTCARGCSACCRIQPVPVTPAETYAILLHVESLPEPRRSEITARFDDRASRLEAAGLADAYLEGRPAVCEEEAKANVQRYLDLHLACPFLENDACSIYEIRPFTCREYLVSSPKELCSDPLTQPIQRVAPIVSGGKAILGAALAVTGTAGFTIPLTLALVYAQRHRNRLSQSYPGRQVFTGSIRTLMSTRR